MRRSGPLGAAARAVIQWACRSPARRNDVSDKEPRDEDRIEDRGARDLLEQPIVAVLATYRRDGTVMLSPVWFEWREAGFNVWVGGANEGKANHVRNDPRASIVVHEQTLPYRGLEASGTVTLNTEDFHDVVRRTAARYVGPDVADDFAAGYTVPGLVIRLVPERLRAWDFRDDTGHADGNDGEPGAA